MPNLVRQIGEEQRTVQLRQATVTAVAANGTASIRFGIGGGVIAGVRGLVTASPLVDATVWVLQQGYDMLILGRISPAPIVLPDGQDLRATWIELRSLAGSPGIDFTRLPGIADYNFRVMNDADNILSFYSSGGARWMRVGTLGGGVQGIFCDGWLRTQISGTGWYHEVHGGGWFMQDNDWVRAYADKGIFTGGDFQARDAILSGNFAIASGKYLYLKGAWDATHIIYHNTADDGFRYQTWNKHQFYIAGGALGLEVNNTNILTFRRNLISSAGGASWNQMQLLVKAASGNNAGIGFEVSTRAVKFCLNFDHGDKLVALNSNDSGYVTVKGLSFETMSAGRHKQNMRPLRGRAAVTAKMLNPVIYEPKHRSSVDPATGKFIDTPMNRKNETAYLGFVAEEVAEYAPEAVGWIVSEPGNPNSEAIPDAIDVMAMVALVAQAVKGLDERLDALEKGAT